MRHRWSAPNIHGMRVFCSGVRAGFWPWARVSLLAAALASASAAGAAGRVIDLSSGTGSFAGDGPLLQSGDDFITFTNLAPGTYSYKFTLSGEGIEGLAASVNGQTAGTFTVGERTFAGLEGKDAAGSFTVQITGRPAGNASYQGQVTIQPEASAPATGPALIVGGLAAMAGFAVWLRRKPSGTRAAPGSQG